MSSIRLTSAARPIPLWSGFDHQAPAPELRQEKAQAGQRGNPLADKQFGFAVLDMTKAGAPGGRWD
jgi:hypothetical protein